MRFELVPLLARQRAIYDLPRDMARFRAYIAELRGGTDDVTYPPMVAMNPMGKDKAPARFDDLIALGAEGIAADALREAERRLARVEGELKVGLSVADDAQGSWSYRTTTEATLWFRGDAGLKRGWVTVLYFTGDALPTRARASARTCSRAPTARAGNSAAARRGRCAT
ncbi:MAG TPA: hypothetical protein VGR28_07615 [Candidatus Thermoplasmatota archaeon]|jgi:hypothetical protein|nr:hypothetical protein [Candidatus Thermoplasmatota archaeon]